MEGNKSKKVTAIIMLGILVVGLVVGIVLVGREQLLRARADVDITKAFSIKDGQGNQINCSGDVCETQSSEVFFELKDINALLQ